jgi:hypothetical protein
VGEHLNELSEEGIGLGFGEKGAMRAVARVDDRVRLEGENARANGAKELRLAAAWKIGAANSAGKERVAREKDGRLP